MADPAAAVAAENIGHEQIVALEDFKNLLLLLLSLLPGCPSSRVLLLLLTERHSSQILQDSNPSRKDVVDYSLSILLVVLMVGIVVRARAEKLHW